MGGGRGPPPPCPWLAARKLRSRNQARPALQPPAPPVIAPEKARPAETGTLSALEQGVTLGFEMRICRAGRKVRDDSGNSDERIKRHQITWPIREASQRRGFGQDMLRRSEEHTSELQSRGHLVCRLLLE